MLTDRDNAWVAERLREFAALLELADAPRRPRAYRRAAISIEQLREPIAKLRRSWGERGLEEIHGIGPHIASVIGELLDTGTSDALERLRKRFPVDVAGLLAVEGVGTKTLRQLWRELGVETVGDLDRALDEERVQALPGFGARRVARLRRAVGIHLRGRGSMPREQAVAIAGRLRDRIAKHPSVVECEIAGSLRRKRPSVGDIDLVAASRDAVAVARLLLDDPDVDYVYSKGPHRVSVRLAAGIDVDLRTVDPSSFGSALLYFTGNRAHTLALRWLASAQGLRLNEYGLFRGTDRIASATEREIYDALALPYFAPEERRGETEIRRALCRAHAGERS